MFETVQPAPPDAILGLTEAFKSDENPSKINLGVGVYQDAAGKTPTLAAVKKAEAIMLDTVASKGYMPIPGSPEYGAHVRTLLFGEGHDLVSSGAAVTAHSPGGTGGLRIGADFIKAIAPSASVWMSSPTWANHKGIFSAAGIAIKDYPYYSADEHGLDFGAMSSALAEIPAGDVVLLHVACHNPTGVDPNVEEWEAIVSIAKDKGWTPFLDFAYQGFDVGVDEDAMAVRLLADAGIEFFVASSFSKNFGLYQDRTGALTVVGKEASHTAAAFSHLKTVIRVNYSNPPAHGGHIVNTILSDSGLKGEWLCELAGMRDRIKEMRSALVDGLKSRGVAQDFSYIVDQKGMFSFSGLNDEQVEALKNDYSIYVVKGGRINVAGITPGNVDYLFDAISKVL